VARRAFVASWLIVTAVTAAMLAAPLLLSARTLTALTPRCYWKARYNRECVLCGMTTAFVHISAGELDEASRSNRASVPLYGGMLVNVCGAALFLLRSRRRR